MSPPWGKAAASRVREAGAGADLSPRIAAKSRFAAASSIGPIWAGVLMPAYVNAAARGLSSILRAMVRGFAAGRAAA
jgi:hypothetical protein